MKSGKFRGEIYFHVIGEDRELGHGDRREVVPGKELKAKVKHNSRGKAHKRPIECQHGMHGCKSILSCEMFPLWPGRWLCIVRLRDKVRHFGTKSAGLRREVVAMRQNTEDHGYQTFSSNEEAYSWVMAKPWKGPEGEGK